jgi:hypothetical protein
MLSSTRLALFNRDRPLTPPNNRQSRRPPRRLRHGSQWKSHNSTREGRSGARQFVRLRRRFWRLLSATTLARNINTGSNVRSFPAIFNITQRQRDEQDITKIDHHRQKPHSVIVLEVIPEWLSACAVHSNNVAFLFLFRPMRQASYSQPAWGGVRRHPDHRS